MILVLLISAALALHCDDSMLSELQSVAQTKARAFMSRSARLAHRLAMSEDDISQEFLIAAWLYSENFDPLKGTPATYFGQKMRWEAASLARKAIPRRSTISINDDENPIDPEAPEAPEHFTDDDRKLVWQAVDLLRGTEKEYMTLFLNGQSVDDIATTFGVKRVRAMRAVRLGIRHLSRIVTTLEH